MRRSLLHQHLISISISLTAALLLATAGAGDHHHRSWMPINKLGETSSSCRGSKCMVENNELINIVMGMESSEVNNRRILATAQYISYAALTANSVPCSISGASYYNCQPGAEANPYVRACTAVTQCRS